MREGDLLTLPIVVLSVAILFLSLHIVRKLATQKQLTAGDALGLLGIATRSGGSSPLAATPAT
jgi:hypothetical protein